MFGGRKVKIDEAKVHFQKDLHRCYGGEDITLAVCGFEHTVGFRGEQLEQGTSFEASGIVHEEWPGERHLRFSISFNDAPSQGRTAPSATFILGEIASNGNRGWRKKYCGWTCL
jgi:hypothetical protein